MERDHSEHHDAGTFSESQRPAPRAIPDDDPEQTDQMGHAGIREEPPGQRHDLNEDNSQGFTGEIGDRNRQFPGSEAARRTIPRNDEDAELRGRRESAERSPDDVEKDQKSD